MVKLYHLGSPQSVHLQFSTAAAREQFVQVLCYHAPNLNPAAGIMRDPTNPYLPLRILVGSWNIGM